LNFTLWKKAEDFWGIVGANEQVKEAFTTIVDDNGGRHERHAVIWKAWEAYRDRETIVKEDLALEYHMTPDGSQPILDEAGRKQLRGYADFGGIDKGAIDASRRAPSADAEGATPAEAEENRREVDAERILRTSRRPAAAGRLGFSDHLAKLRKTYPDVILLIKSASAGIYRAFDDDCEPVRAVLGNGLAVQDDEGHRFVSVPGNRLQHLITALTKANRDVATAAMVDNEVRVDVASAKAKDNTKTTAKAKPTPNANRR
jgi:hypothetical protein